MTSISEFSRRLSCALALGLCMTSYQPRSKQKKTMEDSHMQSTAKKMVPRCIGRFLVNVPEDMVLSAEGGQEIEGVTIDLRVMPEANFDFLLRKRKAKLENTFLPGSNKFPFLKETTALPGNDRGLIFDRAESEAGTSRMSRTLELMAWRDGYRILATVKATDTDFPEFANDAWIKESKTTTAERRARLLNLFRRVRGRSVDEIPAEKGACILNGFVSGSATDSENVTLLYHLKDATDVFFSFNTDSTYTRDDTLVERSKNIEPLLAENQGHTLRRARRTVGAVRDGEEFLYSILGDPNSEHKRIMTYKFVFEANNEIGSAATPLIRVDFDNGEIMPLPEPAEGAPSPPPIARATLSEAEAISMWDAVIPTIRPRPGAF